MSPRPARRSPTTPAQLATARQVASLLLGYPDEELLTRLPLLRAVTAPLPAELAGPLGRFLDHLETTRLERLQTDYVETFDLQRRCSLYLTYYAYGDTRRRGMALLQFTHLYGRAGLHLADGELPDHLAVVLEFTALGDTARGERLLHEHRAGLELIRLALEERRSPWAAVLAAVSATLPPVAAADREEVARLALQGPPTEEVGLDPYGAAPFAPPEYMPQPVSGAPAGAPR
ncbi:nitrate reductase molybdenum cofactor assembly chaperone [Geodermatophilus sabuli]|uniref:Respiratory nitrate reductase chaperone NarJ n=1 Tax=Geodermatophilus sabuli TaxID=1564158 RepID=A0A285E8J6_9ACTN|nr:nitrate reductase molybdenum cofactor assembly chaperone [Geodermatophilus sabuli]MBB3082708.1 nitrate reductase delta subunit [Geodermatophilus sabuli]SNX94426.1 respiratory nitrate reductase chaperone NarJ [Geodermatophilus sabuli]